MGDSGNVVGESDENNVKENDIESKDSDNLTETSFRNSNSSEDVSEGNGDSINGEDKNKSENENGDEDDEEEHYRKASVGQLKSMFEGIVEVFMSSSPTSENSSPTVARRNTGTSVATGGGRNGSATPPDVVPRVKRNNEVTAGNNVRPAASPPVAPRPRVPPPTAAKPATASRRKHSNGTLTPATLRPSLQDDTTDCVDGSDSTCWKDLSWRQLKTRSQDNTVKVDKLQQQFREARARMTSLLKRSSRPTRSDSGGAAMLSITTDDITELTKQMGVLTKKTDEDRKR